MLINKYDVEYDLIELEKFKEKEYNIVYKSPKKFKNKNKDKTKNGLESIKNYRKEVRDIGNLILKNNNILKLNRYNYKYILKFYIRDNLKLDIYLIERDYLKINHYYGNYYMDLDETSDYDFLQGYHNCVGFKNYINSKSIMLGFDDIKAVESFLLKLCGEVKESYFSLNKDKIKRIEILKEGVYFSLIMSYLYRNSNVSVSIDDNLNYLIDEGYLLASEYDYFKSKQYLFAEVDEYINLNKNNKKFVRKLKNKYYDNSKNSDYKNKKYKLRYLEEEY